MATREEYEKLRKVWELLVQYREAAFNAVVATEAENASSAARARVRYKRLQRQLFAEVDAVKELKIEPRGEFHRYVVTLVFQPFSNEDKSVALETAEACAKQCLEWEKEALTTGWWPRVDVAPLDELVWTDRYHQSWQAPDGMLYPAQAQKPLTPREVNWTEEQKEHRYWRSVGWTATLVTSHYAQGAFGYKSPKNPTEELNLWIDIVTSNPPKTQGNKSPTFQADVRKVLTQRGFDLENFKMWGPTFDKIGKVQRQLNDGHERRV